MPIVYFSDIGYGFTGSKVQGFMVECDQTSFLPDFIESE